MLLFALTIFSSAFLLFQVQPLIARYILPWFGGGPGVWTTCMLFFQCVLLCGYAYAHLVIRRLRPRAQVAAHLGLLAVALLLLPITPAARWKLLAAHDPTVRILALLAASVGVQGLALSATGPLMQGWFAVWRPGVSPYRLYALSNLGSLLALVSYPLLIEPSFSRKVQALAWSVGFACTALLSAACALQIWKRAASQASPSDEASAEERDAAPGPVLVGLWLLLPACACVLLLAVTNQLCVDVAVIPFLWVLPLALYLLSFILCFHSPRWYPRPFYLCALLLGVALVSWIPSWTAKEGLSVPFQIAAYGGVLFVCCTVCHGELARLKPPPRHLTLFYLMLAAGGAAGGVFVAVIAPLVFRGYFELPLGLLATVLLALVVVFLDREWLLYHGRPVLVWIPLVLVVLALGSTLFQNARAGLENTVSVTRNFYGVLSVTEQGRDDPAMRHYVLRHGRILHGLQFTREDKRALPTTYYGEESGVGLALRHFAEHAPMRVGAVGLGVGTVAAYGREGDVFRFYEIDPEVERLAQSRFTFLRDTKAHVEVVLGDARVSLEREAPAEFDVLVLDAFSSDAVPVHLLTKEAFEIYLRHLKPEGAIAVHISNKYLDLRPVVFGLADHFGFDHELVVDARGRSRRGDEALAHQDARRGVVTSSWILVTRNRTLLDSEAVRRQRDVPRTEPPQVRLWTDDDSDLLHILRH